MLRNRQRSEGHHGVRIVIRTLRAWRRLGTALEQGRVFVESRGHADVAAEGQHREDIFGLTPSLAKQRRPEADREPRGIDPDRLCGNEVPELVDEDDQSKDEDRCEYR